MITPEQLAKPGTEHAHQCALFCWAAQNFHRWPELELMFAIPNGGKRDKTTGGRLKAEGVKAGVPDIFLPVPRRMMFGTVPINVCGLFIELKKSKVGDNGKSGTLSDEQKEYHDRLRKQGYHVYVCYGWGQAMQAIHNYLNGS